MLVFGLIPVWWDKNIFSYFKVHWKRELHSFLHILKLNTYIFVSMHWTPYVRLNFNHYFDQ
jgi:hypothetical protein